MNLIFYFLFSVFSTLRFLRRLPKLISDGMILQRNQELTIWGWASPEENVTLTFKESEFSTTANPDGNWKIYIPPQEAGGPYKMVFEASNQLTVKNILFGDVWIASGQSNMELWMGRVKYTYKDELQSSENSEIRQFLVPDQYDFKQTHRDFESGEWQSANPETILGFSAVAYFFAKELYEQYRVPIGIINAALGGSPVEAWMSEESLKEFPDAYEELQKFKGDDLIQQIQQEDQERIGNWYSELNQKDRGLSAEPEWSQPNLDDSGWDKMDLPGVRGNVHRRSERGRLVSKRDQRPRTHDRKIRSVVDGPYRGSGFRICEWTVSRNHRIPIPATALSPGFYRFKTRKK